MIFEQDLNADIRHWLNKKGYSDKDIRNLFLNQTYFKSWRMNPGGVTVVRKSSQGDLPQYILDKLRENNIDPTGYKGRVSIEQDVGPKPWRDRVSGHVFARFQVISPEGKILASHTLTSESFDKHEKWFESDKKGVQKITKMGNNWLFMPDEYQINRNLISLLKSFNFEKFSKGETKAYSRYGWNLNRPEYGTTKDFFDQTIEFIKKDYKLNNRKYLEPVDNLAKPISNQSIYNENISKSIDKPKEVEQPIITNDISDDDIIIPETNVYKIDYENNEMVEYVRDKDKYMEVRESFDPDEFKIKKDDNNVNSVLAFPSVPKTKIQLDELTNKKNPDKKTNNKDFGSNREQRKKVNS